MGGRSRYREGSGSLSASRLDPEAAVYFQKALETLQGGLGPEELALFAPNVLSEAVSLGPADVSRHPSGSRVLAALLPLSPLPVLARILPHLVPGGLRGPPGHPLGARALEAALARVLPALREDDADADARGTVEAAVARLVGDVAGDLVAFARHPPSSFVLRVLLQLLAGAPATALPGLPPEGVEPPPSFRALLGQLAAQLEQNLPALQTPSCASLCLQVALEVLPRSQSDAAARLCDAVIGRFAPPGPALPDGALPEGLRDPQASHLLEAAMTAAGPRRLREIFRTHFKGRLRGVASHRVANHGLQRLLDHAPDDVVGEVLSELGPALSEPLAQGHPGVLIALTGACRRNPAHQGEALKYLLQALGCWDPPDRRSQCVEPLAGLRPFGSGDVSDREGAEPEVRVTLWGSLLLQHLLHFAAPGPVLGALGALPAPRLVALARSPPGSRVWDALLASPHVPPRKRRRLLRKLQGHFLSLACHRNGSRVLDAVWAASPVPARAAIAAELAPQREALGRDPYGRRVWRALGLELFLRRRRLWEKLQAAPAAVAALLED